MSRLRNKIFAKFLQSIGFGLVLTGIEDELYQENPNPFVNFGLIIPGALLWCAGMSLQLQQHCSENLSCLPTKNDFLINALSYCGGLGVVNSIAHWSQGIDTNSANLGNLSMGIFLPIVIPEILATSVALPTLKWAKLRFFLVVVADYLYTTGFNPIMNHETIQPYHIIFICVGLPLAISESIYGQLNDKGLDTGRVIMRRSMQITAVLTIAFTINDIIKGRTDPYSISNRVFQLIGGAILLFTVLMLLRKNPAPTAEATSRHRLMGANAEIPPLVELSDGESSDAESSHSSTTSNTPPELR